MSTQLSRFLRIAALTLAVAVPTALAVVSGPAVAKEPAVYTGGANGAAVSGYDPVAYFTEGKPVPGKGELTAEYNGATWRFASEANRAAFKAEPAKYAPQYGGYCSWAVSLGYTASADPRAWRIVGGKLYLNYSKDVQETWSKDIPKNISKADANWPNVLAK